MLVLSRHKDESIMIGDNVMITIHEIRPDQVRLRFNAPNEIPVHRQEVYEAIRREQSKNGPESCEDSPDQNKKRENPEKPGLVLSRHRDESVMIGDNVMITIVDIRGDKVRLGIEAPQEIPVHRQEVYEAIKRENEKAQRNNIL